LKQLAAAIRTKWSPHVPSFSILAKYSGHDAYPETKLTKAVPSLFEKRKRDV